MPASTRASPSSAAHTATPANISGPFGAGVEPLYIAIGVQVSASPSSGHAVRDHRVRHQAASATSSEQTSASSPRIT